MNGDIKHYMEQLNDYDIELRRIGEVFHVYINKKIQAVMSEYDLGWYLSGIIVGLEIKKEKKILLK